MSRLRYAPGMSERPFHHGNLRAVLLDQAEIVLRERGVDGLSLRELARDAGVSHGAPRSHFIDKNALLDALAERGFQRMALAISEATEHAHGTYADTLRAAAGAALDFAVRDAALLDLMFAAKVSDPSDVVKSAAATLFAAIGAVMQAGVADGVFDERSVERLSLVWSATVQGVSTLVTSRRATIEQAHGVIDDAVALFLSGSLDGSAGR